MVNGTHNAVEDSRNDDILVYINGDFFSRNAAKISVFDSGYLVGDGIWEAIRLHDDILVFIDDHLERMWSAAATIGMDLKMSKEELKKKIHKTLIANDMHDNVHVRIMVTRGIKKTPSQDPRLTISGPNIVIIPEYKVASDQSAQKGITLFTSTIRRGSPDYLDPKLNCHSKLHEVQALIQAIEAGADEALMLDVHGFVATCNATNFFMIKNGEVWTSSGKYCMNGITRSKVIAICEGMGIPCYQKDFSLFDVYGADEAFVTGTFGGLTPVVKIDGRVIGTGEKGDLTDRLSGYYKLLIESEVRKMRNKRMPTKRICLWSGPRNISTALMYSFAQRSDTAVVDEPLYAHYLSVSDASEYHPGAKKVLSSQENDGKKVIASMLENDKAPVIFYKHMAHHLEGLDLRFLESTVNIILTREPREMITSFAKVIPNPSLKDLGYEQQVELFEKLKSMEHVPIVLDSKKILLNPETTLRNLCNRLDIPFQPEMLRWKAGARKEDGVWAKHWYKNVHESVGFAPYTPKNDIISDDLKDVLDESESLYSRLIKNSI